MYAEPAFDREPPHGDEPSAHRPLVMYYTAL